MKLYKKLSNGVKNLLKIFSGVKKNFLILIAAVILVVGGFFLTNIDLIQGAAKNADTLDNMDWNGTECAQNNPTCNIKAYIDSKGTPCTDNNSGNCYITQATKSALDADLVAGNIMSGVTIFGITGTGGTMTCYSGGNPQTTNWSAGLYGCMGSNKRCYSGSCITCGGWMNAGYCWWSGELNQSCTFVCSTRGGVYGGNCNWVNDPSDCSTCRHFYPGKSCWGPSSGGPQHNTAFNVCTYHSPGGDDCSFGNNVNYRQCACNQ